MQTLFWKNFTIFIMLNLLVSCSSAPTAPPPIEFDISTDYQTNDGRLFYFVVRRVDNEKQFMQESYLNIANTAFSSQQGSATLGVFSITPGVVQEYSLDAPAQGNIALYFLFTQPGSQWKKLLAMPLEEGYNINLKANNQVEIEKLGWWEGVEWLSILKILSFGLLFL
jgi:hypothetical protein